MRNKTTVLYMLATIFILWAALVYLRWPNEKFDCWDKTPITSWNSGTKCVDFNSKK